MPSRGSGGSGFPAALATIGVLCLPSLGYVVAICWELLLRLLGERVQTPRSYGFILIIHIVTFPWAYLIAATLGTWVLARGNRRARVWALCILGVALIPNLLIWRSYSRSF